MNDNKEYLSEERYQKSSAKLKGIGKTLLIIGIVTLVISFILIILGFILFGGRGVSAIAADVVDNSKAASGVFGGFGLIAFGGFLNTIGFGLTIAGVATMVIAHRREITAFTTQQVMPVAQEGIEKMTPTIGKAGASIAKEMAPVYGEAAKEIAKGIKEGLNEADEEEITDEEEKEEK